MTIANPKTKPINFLKVKKIIISMTEPQFSEVWMTRINYLFSENDLFISTEGDLSKNKIDNLNYISLFEKIPLPQFLRFKIYKYFANKKLKNILKKIPDNAVVLCHFLTTAEFYKSVIFSSNKKFYIFCHGHDITWDRKEEKFPIFNAHHKNYTKNVKKLIGKVHLISNSICSTQKLLDIGFKKDEISLNYLSVDTSMYKPLNQKRERKLIKIVFLGRLVDFKGPLETIRAFSKLIKLGFKSKLDILGDGVKMGACKKLVNDLGIENNVFFHGAVDKDKAKYFLQQADIFTAHNQRSKITNQEEAFGVAVIEAMACGLPIVSGASGGLKETVTNGLSGILFEPGDIDAHANALVKLASDQNLRIKMGIYARKIVCTKFNSKYDKKKLYNILETSF